MRNYFEEMNIDYDELKRYEDIETYYDEVQDYSKLIQELQCDRVEVLKQIVNKNKEIERLEENKKLKKKNKELKETKERLEKKIKTAISFFESEEFKKSCKVLTEKLDNTGEYGHWLIVREYIDCVKERLR